MSVTARYKIVVMGEGGVGKTTLIRRYLTGIFDDNPILTIGMDFSVKNVNLNNKKIKLQIWDFAGEDRFRFLLPGCVQGTHGAILMYDMTRYATLKNLANWLKIFRECNNGECKNVPILLVGGKSDLDYKRSVSKEDAIDLANSQDINGFLECSSAIGDNIEEIFRTVAKLVSINRSLS